MKQGLDEKIFVEINGVRQGMFLQSEDIENPVLLFLHGGPGSPEIVFAAENPTGLEKMFTVCWWEQRGSGISYRGISKETMTMEQMIADTVSVVHYLLNRFQKEKLYVMGHSWGSVLGMLTVQRVPELFSAILALDRSRGRMRRNGSPTTICWRNSAPRKTNGCFASWRSSRSIKAARSVNGISPCAARE